MAFKSPFDLQYWFVNVFAGSVELFSAILLLVIGLASIQFGFPILVTAVSFSMLFLMLSAYFTGLPILVAVIGGLLIGWIISRIFK